MSDFAQFAFSGGVLSKAFTARPDVEKYDLGLREGSNWFIDFRGGASTRPSLEFIDYLMYTDTKVRPVAFNFNSQLANTYLMLFGNQYIRFVQDGAYVLEATKAIVSITTGDPTTVEVTGHGYSNGDLIKIAGPSQYEPYLFEVSNVATNTFDLVLPDGTNLDSTGFTAYVSGGTVARVYTVSTPYTAANLDGLSFDQFRDEVIITSTDYPAKKLIRYDTTNWTLSNVNFDGNTNAPTGVSSTPSSASTASIIYGVTGINLDGQESYMKDMVLNTGLLDISSTAGHIEINWDIETNTEYYNVYRSLIYANSADMTYGQELGYLGKAFGTTFTDTNIVPDFTKHPPQRYNPFENGAVLHLNVTALGSGYGKNTTTVSLSGGTGFEGIPVINNAGEILGVRILSPGSGYTSSSTVTFTDSGGTPGSGATATAVTTEASGNYPNSSIMFKQRRLYLSTVNKPMTIFGSRTGAYDDFTYSLDATAADSFELSLDSPELTPIKYGVVGPLGLFVFTEKSVYEINSVTGQAFSPTSAKAEPRMGVGVADVKPLTVDDGFLFLQSKSTSVRAIHPTSLQNSYQIKDISVFSSQFFTSSNQITSWTKAINPDRLLWASRADGTMLTCTYVPEHNVYAWANHFTNGEVEYVESVFENGLDRTYAVVKRTVNGKTYRFIERFAVRHVSNVEDLYAVDSCISTALTYPAGTLTLDKTQVSETATVTCSASSFASGDVGKHIRVGNGRLTITAFTSATTVSGIIEIEITDVNPQTGLPKVYDTGTWSLDSKVTTVSGLNHLEGETVQIFADGNEFPSKTVTNGAVTLSTAASFVVVGLAFDAVLSTLPLTSTSRLITKKKKRVSGLGLRLTDARDLAVAQYGDTNFYKIKERTFEAYGTPTLPMDGLHLISISADWDRDGSITVKKSGPFGATVLGLILDADIGGD